MARSPKRSRGFDDVTASAPPAARPRRPPRSFEETAALIGVVKELSNPRCARPGWQDSRLHGVFGVLETVDFFGFFVPNFDVSATRKTFVVSGCHPDGNVDVNLDVVSPTGALSDVESVVEHQFSTAKHPDS